METPSEKNLNGAVLPQIGGINAEIKINGEGNTVLFLHPGDSIESSSPFLDELCRKYHVVAPSHPGFGDTDLPEWMTSVDDLSYFYLDLMQELDLRDVILVGVSFGGWIAAEIATKSPSRVSGLVLVGATGARFGDASTREIADIFEVPPYELGKLFFKDEKRWDLGYSKLEQDQLMRLARNRESFGMYAWAPTLHSHKLRHRLHLIKVPTVLAWGANDAVVSSEYGRKFADAIPGSTFTLIDDAGHYAHVERPGDVMAAVDLVAHSAAKTQ